MTIELQVENETIEDGSRYVTEAFRPKPRGPNYRKRLMEAYRLFNAAMSGNQYAMLDLKEAFSTSDFPLLFADVLSRELLPEYQAAPTIWTSFARRTVVRDFRPHTLSDLFGGQGILERVPELGPYPAKKVEEAEYKLRVRKHGSRFALSWEALVNDDLGGLRGLPNRMAVSARRSEDYHATAQLVGATGPLTAFWKAYTAPPAQGTFNNTATAANMGTALGANPQLSTDSVAKALEVIQTRRDIDNAPVIIDGFVLMVPPALELAANKILGANELRFTDPEGNVIIVGNFLNGRVTLVVNPWLPVIDQSANAATTWYVLPTPSSPRPALAVGFLRGNETPDLRMKSSDSERVGGGDVPPEEGSFDNDDVQYRVRHVFGGATVDPMSTLVSNGSEA
jgi:hypothetical protein